MHFQCKQAIPVIANDCIVRSFYFIRRFAIALKSLNCSSVGNIRLKEIDWDSLKPFGNPTITRMLTISSAVFSTVDIAEAVRELLEEKAYKDDDIYISQIRLVGSTEDQIENVFVQRLSFDVKVTAF